MLAFRRRRHRRRRRPSIQNSRYIVCRRRRNIGRLLEPISQIFLELLYSQIQPIRAGEINSHVIFYGEFNFSACTTELVKIVLLLKVLFTSHICVQTL